MTINQNQTENFEHKQRKWSTFLQKPTNPVPDLKLQNEKTNNQGEPYRVVIKKQWRKGDKSKHIEVKFY